MYKADFFYSRYGSATAKKVKPNIFGDFFHSSFQKNVVFGDYLTAVNYGFKSSSQLVADRSANFYGQYITVWNTFFSGDTMNSTGTPMWDGQTGKDTVLGSVVSADAKVVATLVQRLFTDHNLTMQIVRDLYNFPNTDRKFKGANSRQACNPSSNSYIPSHELQASATVYRPNLLVSDKLPIPLVFSTEHIFTLSLPASKYSCQIQPRQRKVLKALQG